MAKKPKLTPEEQEQQRLLERHFERVKRQLRDEVLERARAEEEAEKKRSA
jgi:hypothetical protein